MEPWKRQVQQFGVVAGIALVIYLFFTHIDFGYQFHWAVLWEMNPTYEEVFGFWLIRGLLLTLEITLISTAVSLVLGTFFGIARLSTFKPLNWFATVYVEFFRNTPLLVQLFFWYFAFPLALPDVVREFLYDHNYELIAATGGLSIYTAAFIAEIVRAGIQAIPKGHLEAAASCGLSRVQALRFVILPQAFRVIMPPLGSELLNNMKNSSLAMTIGVADLCWQAQQIESFTFRGFEATTAATVIYLSLSLIISMLMSSVTHHLEVGEKKELSVLDKGLGLLVRPFPLLVGMLAGGLHRAWNVLRPEKEKHLEVEIAYLSTGTQWLERLIGVLSIGGKALFLLILFALLAAVGYGLYGFNWDVIFDNFRSLLIWTFPHGLGGEIFYGLGGLSLSIVLAFIALTASFAIGLVAGLGRLSKNPLISTPSILYIELIRGNPLIMVIFWIYFFSPIITGMQMDVFWSATIAFTIFSGAYLAEIVRAGVKAIPPGQMEAATASGLNYFKAMRFVILPQALKMMIPAIVGQFIALFKDTSLAYIIGVFELTTVAQTINNRIMIYPFEIYTTIAVLYFICCYSMSMVARRLEHKYTPEARFDIPDMA